MLETGKISARPQPVVGAGLTGEFPLHLDRRRDTLLYVPAVVAARWPLPLCVVLHGAGGEARHGLELLKPWAHEAGVMLLAPASRGRTWDVILEAYGPDVAMIDRSLQEVFRRYPVDTDRIAVGGFSDGASYALSIGLGNGDVFTHILAFSPGFVASNTKQGQPQVFVSHGVSDTVLPIDRCSRRIVPRLRRAGYDVTYREFDGSHVILPEIAAEALDWFRQMASDRPPSIVLP